MATTIFFQWRSKNVGARSQLYAMRFTFSLAADGMAGNRCDDILARAHGRQVIACVF